MHFYAILWTSSLTLALDLLTIESANHYCVNQNTVSLELDDFFHRDETIIAQVADEPVSKKRQRMSCRWEVSLASVQPHLQLVLEMRGSRDADEQDSGQSEGLMRLDSITPLSDGMFLVQPVRDRAHFTVQANWNQKALNPIVQRLRIRIPLPGVCSRDMLSFRGNCYAVTTALQTTKQVVSSVGGSAQLASFSSMAQIRDLIKANNARLNSFPYRRPLSLSLPVHLGLFLRSADGAVVSIGRNEDSCDLLQQEQEFTQFSTIDGPCASLRFPTDSNEPNRAVIEFVNCSRPMLSLLSFPNTARRFVESSELCDSGNASRFHSQLAELEKMFQEFNNDGRNDSSNATTTNYWHFHSDVSPLKVHLFGIICILLVNACIVAFFAPIVKIFSSKIYTYSSVSDAAIQKV